MEQEVIKFREYSKIKGSDRIQINNLLVAICVPTLTIIISLTEVFINEASIIQLSLAIPLLVSSSLSYAKIAYRKEDEYKIWDNMGWVCHSLGYIMIINSTALTLYFNDDIFTAWLFIGFTTLLFMVYSMIDITLKSYRKKEKLLKLLFYISIIILGFILPVLLN